MIPPALARVVTPTILTFSSAWTDPTKVETPAGFTALGERLQLYINGIVIPATFYSVTQSGNDISVVLQTNQTEYTLDSGDEVVLSGKIK